MLPAIRDVSRLEPHVAKNVPLFILRCAEKGAPVLITETIRTAARQRELCNAGYSTTPTPSFHSEQAGLAFDVCKNVKGHEYDDPVFWAIVGKVGKEMGFTWGGDWTKFVDKPHFQWDGHGAVTGAQVRAGLRPPPMPLYKDPIVLLAEELTRKGILTATAYWADVMKGTQPVNLEYLVKLLTNVSKKL